MINYSLVVRNVENAGQFESLSAALEEFDLERYVFDTGAYFSKEKEAIFSTWEEQNWLEHHGLMIIISEKFPKMTFELTMQENDCFDKYYYKDGEFERCMGEVIYERPKKIEWDALLAF